MIKYFPILLLVTMNYGCNGTWRETTTSTIDSLKRYIVEPAEKSTKSYLEERCTKAADEAKTNGCLPDKMDSIECKPVVDCMNLTDKVNAAFVSFYESARLAMIAVTLDKQTDAEAYLNKAVEAAKSLYTILKAWLKDAIPNIPFLTN